MNTMANLFAQLFAWVASPWRSVLALALLPTKDVLADPEPRYTVRNVSLLG